MTPECDDLLVDFVLGAYRDECGRLPYDLDEANRQFAERIIRIWIGWPSALALSHPELPAGVVAEYERRKQSVIDARINLCRRRRLLERSRRERIGLEAKLRWTRAQLDRFRL